MIHLCSACGTSYASLSAPPLRCKICDDERQFVPVKGQRWTTEATLHGDHANKWRQLSPNVLSIQTEPRFAIGQRAFLITTPHGNILWDCLACIDASTITLVRSLGGISAIAISHPHYYTTMQDWASTFDAKIFLHADDREWVLRDSPYINFWSGGSCSIAHDMSLVRLGGRTKGGMNMKLHAVTDANGRPLSVFMTAGQVSDYTGAAALLDDLPRAQWLLGDRGYDADWTRDALQSKGI